LSPDSEMLLNETDTLYAEDVDCEGPISGINDGSTKGWKNSDSG